MPRSHFLVLFGLVVAPAAAFFSASADRRVIPAAAPARIRASLPLALAKKKKSKKAKAAGRPPPPPPMPATAPPPAAADSMQLMQVIVPDGMGPGQALQVQSPAGLVQVDIPEGVGPGAAFEVLLPTAAAPPPAPAMATPEPVMPTPEPMMPTPPQPLEIPPPATAAVDDFDDVALPALEPLQLDLDESKVKLPSFDEYKRGPPKPVPSSTSYTSKLPSINQGRSVYDDLPEKEEKPPLEKLVFGLTWGGIFFLIAVEIFINTPWFQQVKPAILNFLSDGANVVE